MSEPALTPQARRSLAAVRRYTQLGYSPIPCWPGQKKSMVKWEPFRERQATDAEWIDWLTGTPDANVALVLTGGAFAIDEDGDTALCEELLSAAGINIRELQKVAPVQDTPSGGRHTLTNAGDVPMQNGAGILRCDGAAIDARSSGKGYICCWPSEVEDIDKETGEILGPRKPYPGWRGKLPALADLPLTPPEVIEVFRVKEKTSPPPKDGEPFTAPLGELPEWVTHYMLGAVETSWARANPERVNGRVLVRDVACTKLVGFFIGRGDEPALVEAIMQAWARLCDPPFPHTLVREKIARAAREWERNERKKTVEVEEEPEPDRDDEEKAAVFPESAWRGTFQQYRELMHPTTEAPDVLHFATYMSALAASIGRRLKMPAGAGEFVHCNEYVLVLTGTGEKKTTTTSMLQRLLADADHVAYKSAVGSGEGVAKWMEQDASFGVKRSHALRVDEFSALMVQAQREGSALYDLLLEVYNCPPSHEMAFRGQNAITVPMPTLTLLAASTPEHLWRRISARDFESGFVNRFAVFWAGTSERLIPRPPMLDADRVAQFRDHVALVGKVEPRIIEMDFEAEQVWDTYYAEVTTRKRKQGGLLGDAVRRIDSHVKKLAMIYAASEDTYNVTAAQVQAAVDVGWFLWDSAAALVAEQAGETPLSRLETRVVKFLRRRGGRASRRDAQRNAGGGSTEEFNRVVKGLREGHRLREFEARTPSGQTARWMELIG